MALQELKEAIQATEKAEKELSDAVECGRIGMVRKVWLGTRVQHSFLSDQMFQPSLYHITPHTTHHVTFQVKNDACHKQVVELTMELAK